ncbi:GTPase Obg [Geodia barretti]|nr:GTPase Obg [Geodia barretti]
MVETSNGAQVAVADIPGLVPGAHLNKGLGLSFLRHVERCKSLVYILDVSSSEHDMVTQLRILQNELDCYQPGMNQCARLVVANKMDVLDRVGNESMSSLARVTRLPVLPVSALHGWNIDVLMKALTTDNQSYAV